MENITPAIKLNPHYRHSGTVFNSIIMEHDQHRYFLPCGQDDSIYAFQKGVGVYVLNFNESKGYIGFSSYMAPETYPINSVFLHGIKEIEETLGALWMSMEPVDVATVLMDCLY